MPCLYTSFFGYGGGAGSSIPDGAIAYMDFINGIYYAGGADQAVTDMLGGGFDVNAIDASGLFVDEAGTNEPAAIGALLTDLTSGLTDGMTIICDMDCTAAADSKPKGYFLWLSNTAGSDFARVFIDATNGTGVYMDDSVSFFVNGGNSDFTTFGQNKIGVTLYRDLGGGSYEFAGAVNGGTAFTDTGTSSGSFITVDDAEIFCTNAFTFRMNDIYIKTFALYPPKTGAELTALTA